jgi:hypothetical protein
LAYEKKLGKKLDRLIKTGKLSGRLFSKHWFHFEDQNGPGWAQPDFFILEPGRVTCFEAKLTQTTAAWDQLEKLYRPLLEFTFKRPVRSIQVCKNLRERDETIIRSFSELHNGATLHWLGV